MKKILILLFSILILPLSINASEVYYCLEDGRTGFDTEDNFQQTNFKTDKLKIMIDFDNQEIISEKINFTSDEVQKCYFNYETLYCMNSLGTSFSIHKPTLKYFYADIYNVANMTNDPRIAHGTCEKF